MVRKISISRNNDHVIEYIDFGSLPIRIPGYAYAQILNCNDKLIVHIGSILYFEDDLMRT